MISKKKQFLEVLKDPTKAFIRKQVAEFERIMPDLIRFATYDVGMYTIETTETESNIHKIDITLATADLFSIVEIALNRLFPPSTDYVIHSIIGAPHKTYTAPDGDIVYKSTYFIAKTSDL